MKWKYIVLSLLAALLVAAFVYVYGGSRVPSGQASLRSLNAQNVADVEDIFNAAKDDVRVLLLLSPT